MCLQRYTSLPMIRLSRFHSLVSYLITSRFKQASACQPPSRKTSLTREELSHVQTVKNQKPIDMGGYQCPLRLWLHTRFWPCLKTGKRPLISTISGKCMHQHFSKNFMDQGRNWTGAKLTSGQALGKRSNQHPKSKISSLDFGCWILNTVWPRRLGSADIALSCSNLCYLLFAMTSRLTSSRRSAFIDLWSSSVGLILAGLGSRPLGIPVGCLATCPCLESTWIH